MSPLDEVEVGWSDASMIRVFLGNRGALRFAFSYHTAENPSRTVGRAPAVVVAVFLAWKRRPFASTPTQSAQARSLAWREAARRLLRVCLREPEGSPLVAAVEAAAMLGGDPSAFPQSRKGFRSGKRRA